MKCTYCNEKVTLNPSALERAKRYGGKPSDYEKLFNRHSECHVKARSQSTLNLIRQLNK